MAAFGVFLDFTKAFDFALDLLKIVKTLKILKIPSFGNITKGVLWPNPATPKKH